MDMHTRAPRRVFVDLVPGAPPGAPLALESDADVACSERNILVWMEYLPEDCIRTMILMGWDLTT